jgi:mono/diheme cytochrome c family protein
MATSARHSVLASIGAASLVLGLAFVAALALAVRGGFSTRAEPSVLEALAARAARSLALPARARKLPAPPVTPEALSEAGVHWAAHCASCHGVDGAGDTPIGQHLYPRPPDLRALDSQRRGDGELYFVIKNGVRLTGMPAWGEPGDDDGESWALVAFIRTLPRLTDAELAELRAQLPRTPHELAEDLEEQRFLRGEPAPAENPQEHRHE